MTGFGRVFLGFIASMGGVFVLFIVASGLIERLLFGEGYTGSTTYRLLQYFYVAGTLPDSPIVGFGFARNIGDVVSIRPLDSYYLRMVLEGGFVGLFFMLAAFYYAMRTQLAILKANIDEFSRHVAMGMFVSTVVAALLGLVLSLPADRMYIFIAMAITIALHWLYSEQETPDRPVTAAVAKRS